MFTKSLIAAFAAAALVAGIQAPASAAPVAIGKPAVESPAASPLMVVGGGHGGFRRHHFGHRRWHRRHRYYGHRYGWRKHRYGGSWAAYRRCKWKQHQGYRIYCRKPYRTYY